MKPTSTMKKERESRAEVALRPQEESAALELRKLVAAFRPGIEQRQEMNCETQAALDGIDGACRDYIAAAEQAWKDNRASWYSALEWGPTRPPDSITSGLGRLVATFRADHVDTIRVFLDSGRTKSRPALSEKRFRHDLDRDCGAILNAIDVAIEAGYARVRAAREAEAALRNTVRYWLDHDACRQTIAAALATTEELPTSVRAPAALEDLRRIQHTTINEEQIAARPAPQELFVHAWRGWLPIAREILTERQQAAA